MLELGGGTEGPDVGAGVGGGRCLVAAEPFHGVAFVRGTQREVCVDGVGQAQAQAQRVESQAIGARPQKLGPVWTRVVSEI